MPFFSRRAASSSRHARRQRKLFFDRLENRALLATFTVSSLADSGTGTLREAIALANANGVSDVINFSVSGTITPTSPLPGISTQVEINGAGQSIELNGSSVPGATGLEFNGGSGAEVLSAT